jgi:hypothetical protein
MIRANLPPDPFDDPSMRDFGGPYASRELPSDRWVASGGLYAGRGPRGPLPRSIRAAKLTMYIQSGLLVLLLTPVYEAGHGWAVPIVAVGAALVLWAGVSMIWGRGGVRQVAIWLELVLVPASIVMWLGGVTGALVSVVVAVTAASMLLARRSAELNEP